MTAGSSPRTAGQRRAVRRTRRGRRVLLAALGIEAILVAPQVLIVAALGVEAGKGLIWPLWFWMFVLSLVVSILAFVSLIMAAMDTAAHRITAGQAVRKIVGSAVLALLAPLTIFVVPLLAAVGFGRP